MIFNELNKANFSKILPLYNDDLKAVEIYLSLHNLFYSFFDFDNAPDFMSKYEKHAQFILNSYNMINISTLNIEDNSLVAKSIALSRAITDERILHVILPLDQNNQIVQSSNEGGGVFDLVKTFKANIEFITPETKNFWQYFIHKYPFLVSYTKNVYDYYSCHYVSNELKIDVPKSKSSENEVAFSIRYSFDWFDQVKRKLEDIGWKVSTQVSFKSKMLICDNVEDRYIALMYGIPVVMINMT